MAPEHEPGSAPGREAIRDNVAEALATIPDPEIGIDIVSLGLIDSIEPATDGSVHVRYTLTRMGCPAAPLIQEAIVRRAAGVAGVGTVTAELVMDPPWTPERMSDAARLQLTGGL